VPPSMLCAQTTREFFALRSRCPLVRGSFSWPHGHLCDILTATSRFGRRDATDGRLPDSTCGGESSAGCRHRCVKPRAGSDRVRRIECDIRARGTPLVGLAPDEHPKGRIAGDVGPTRWLVLRRRNWRQFGSLTHAERARLRPASASGGLSMRHSVAFARVRGSQGSRRGSRR
jgi:hypothetical protein